MPETQQLQKGAEWLEAREKGFDLLVPFPFLNHLNALFFFFFQMNALFFKK